LPRLSELCSFARLFRLKAGKRREHREDVEDNQRGPAANATIMTMTSRVERIHTATASPTDASTQRDVERCAADRCQRLCFDCGGCRGHMSERRKCLGQ
jgi:hypothetical protein